MGEVNILLQCKKCGFIMSVAKSWFKKWGFKCPRCKSEEYRIML